MRACRRPTEAACLRERKCANNHQLIVAGVLRFYDTHAQLTSLWYKHPKRRVRYVYANTYFLYTETLTHMRVLRNDEICFSSVDAMCLNG